MAASQVKKGTNKVLAAVVTVLLILIILFVPRGGEVSEVENPDENLATGLLKTVGVIEEEPTPLTTVVLGGDVMLGRTVMTTSIDNEEDPRYPFLKIGDTLFNSDISFVNLEAPIIDDCPRHYEGFIFCADPRMVSGLVYAGVDVVSLENNHILNYGQDGVGQTKAFLSQKDIGYVGKGDLYVEEVRGTKFGFIAFNKVDDPDDFTPGELDFVRRASEDVDVLIGSVHWGVEYVETPTEKQEEWANFLVDAGVDVVVGHHPHWVQSLATIKGKPVYYSLGNLVFDQMWSEKTREGLVVKLTFDGKEIVDEEFIKTYMEEWAQPKVVE